MNNNFVKYTMILFLLVCMSCTDKEMAILIEQPFNSTLDGKEVIIKIDETVIYNGKLESTNIASKYKEALFKAEEEKKYKLVVELNNEVFTYDFSFPDERHILLSPSYINGKTNVGILKQKDKFILH